MMGFLEPMTGPWADITCVPIGRGFTIWSDQEPGVGDLASKPWFHGGKTG